MNTFFNQMVLCFIELNFLIKGRLVSNSILLSIFSSRPSVSFSSVFCWQIIIVFVVVVVIIILNFLTSGPSPNSPFFLWQKRRGLEEEEMGEDES